MNKVAVIGLTGRSVFMGVDHFHAKSETLHATDIHIEFGGKGFNQAVAAARHGATVSFLSAIGEEDQAEVSSCLEAESINFIPAAKKTASAYAVILTDKSGDNQVTVYPGAELTDADVSLFEEEIASADYLLLNNEVPESVNILAAKIAKRAGTEIILNPAPARHLSPDLITEVSLFTPNEAEVAAIPPDADAVVTLGGDGCLIRSRGKHIPPASFGRTVDTTGAGDTFNGVLAAALAGGDSLEKAAEEANKAAAKSVTVRYVLPSIPRRLQ